MDIVNILESFDTSPVSWKWINKKDNKHNSPLARIAAFVIDGIEYKVNITTTNDPNDRIYEIAFYMGDDDQGDNDRMTNTGNQYKVLSTVMDIMESFIVKHKKVIKGIIFAANKRISKYDYEESDSRDKVYRRLIYKNIKKLPGIWSVTETNNKSGNFIVFHLHNHNFNEQ